MGQFDDIILGKKAVQKGKDSAEFTWVDGVFVRRDPFITGDSPKPTDATVTPQYSPTKFPGSTVPNAADGSPSSIRPLGYSFDSPDPTGAGTMPSELQFLSPDEDEMVSPAGFDAPEPLNRPQGALGLRAGDGYILVKGSSGQYAPVEGQSEAKPGLFKSVILPDEKDQMQTHVNAGTLAPLDNSGNDNASGQPITDPEKTRRRVERSRKIRLF